MERRTYIWESLLYSMHEVWSAHLCAFMRGDSISNMDIRLAKPLWGKEPHNPSVSASTLNLKMVSMPIIPQRQ